MLIQTSERVKENEDDDYYALTRDTRRQLANGGELYLHCAPHHTRLTR